MARPSASIGVPSLGPVWIVSMGWMSVRGQGANTEQMVKWPGFVRMSSDLEVSCPLILHSEPTLRQHQVPGRKAVTLVKLKSQSPILPSMPWKVLQQHPYAPPPFPFLPNQTFYLVTTIYDYTTQLHQLQEKRQKNSGKLLSWGIAYGGHVTMKICPCRFLGQETLILVDCHCSEHGLHCCPVSMMLHGSSLTP